MFMCGSNKEILFRRIGKADDVQSNSTDSTEVSGTGEKVENRREKLFIIDMLKGGGDNQKSPTKEVIVLDIVTIKRYK